MKIPGFKFDYVIRIEGVNGILTINEDQRCISRWELLRAGLWFISAALFPRKDVP